MSLMPQLFAFQSVAALAQFDLVEFTPMNRR